MIKISVSCKKCASTNVIKNGYNSSKNPKHKCKDCGFGGVLSSKRKSEAEKEQLIKAAQERSSSRGLARIFGVSHQTDLNWIKKKALAAINNFLESVLSPAVEASTVLELDELCGAARAVLCPKEVQ